MKKEIKNVVNNKVILNLIQDLQRSLLLFVNGMRGRFQIKFGMTSLYNNGAFTLIELLVVVLIIGILAAVAVPQYKLAVVRSRISIYLPLLKSFSQTNEIYYLANGSYAEGNDSKFDLTLPSQCSYINYNQYMCDNDILFDFSNQHGIKFSYCPNYNTTPTTCNSKKDFDIFYYYIHGVAPSTLRGKTYCETKNSSKLGKKICKTFSI